MFCLPFWYFPLIFSPFPFIPFHYCLYSPNEWDHIMFVLLRLTYFTQHNTLQFHPRWSEWWVFVISNGWGIFHCIHRPQLLYPFISQWTPRLLPQSGYCGHCCYKHRGAGVPAFHCICIFGVNPQQCNCWVEGQIYFSLFEEPPHSFPEWLHQFTFPPTVQEGSLFSAFSSTFVFSCLVNFPHSHWCEVVSHCGFDLYFPDGKWCREFPHVLR